MWQKSNLSGKVLPTIMGDNVTVGHSAILHGCTVEYEAFVGMGATLLDGVLVEKHSMVAARALVKQNTKIPSGQLIWSNNWSKWSSNLGNGWDIKFSSKSLRRWSS
ncbi:microtubule binding motor protein [Lithospermum erythrorhizon]|uniref:Microtubule binding motor protein n=1 Tax=Lithospermum erythrorhizon TaxID=34254 RepID=A0AAV3PRH4_LITER